jgi:polyisoprenoid-binding protein YceI
MRYRVFTSVVAISGLAVASISVAAGLRALKDFSFADPKGVNSVHWLIDSPIEPIAGVAEKIEGNLSIDPSNMSAASGSLTIPTASLRAPVEAMSGHLKSDRWLNAEKYPSIKFTLKKVENLKKVSDGTYTADAIGDLTIKDVTKEITAKAEGAYRVDGMKLRMRGAAGDTFRVRATFKIKRSDYGIGPADTTVVGDTIELTAAITGMSPAK